MHQVALWGAWHNLASSINPCHILVHYIFQIHLLSIGLSLSASFHLEAYRPLTWVVQLLHPPAPTRYPSPLDLCWGQMGFPKIQRTGKCSSQVVLPESCLSQPSLAGAILKLLSGPLSKQLPLCPRVAYLK